MALRPWIAALILCLPPTLAARADPAAATLAAAALAAAERAAASGQAGTAVALLEPLRPVAGADEIRRLRALAFAYGRQGRPRAAIAPLERLVALRPQEVRYRLELAAALALAGQDDRARYHFELSRGAGLPPDVLGQVQARIGAIDRRKNWEGHFRFALVPESNAARRTAAERVTVGGWRIGRATGPGCRGRARGSISEGSTFSTAGCGSVSTLCWTPTTTKGCTRCSGWNAATAG